MAEWFIPATVGRATISNWFQTKLNHRFEETIGTQPIWQGYIWSMTLTIDGYREHISLAQVWNAIKTSYTDTNDAKQETSWYINQESINQFGRKEFIHYTDAITTAEAEAAAQTRLQQFAQPYPRVTGIQKRFQDGLWITAVGDIFTANYKFITASPGSNYTDYITNILTDDCAQLTAQNIATNTLTSTAYDKDTRAWDALLELTQRGDASFNPHQILVTNNGNVTYQQADNTPNYYWHGRRIGLTTSNRGPNNPWTQKPAVVRNNTRPAAAAYPNTFLQQSRDNWVQEVQMAHDAEEALLLPEGITAQTIESKKWQYEKWIT